jgi:predicted RNA-binding Zn-ribbon protein involved in translation (DUF1610 family)
MEKLTDAIKEKSLPAEKYHKDGVFLEPVVRCDSCGKLCLVADLKKAGLCPFCGNTKVRNVRTITDAEVKEMTAAGVDPDWLALFEPMDLPTSEPAGGGYE